MLSPECQSELLALWRLAFAAAIGDWELDDLVERMESFGVSFVNESRRRRQVKWVNDRYVEA